MTLKEKINGLLSDIVLRTDTYDLQDIQQELLQLKKNFNNPLSVAVIGLIKAGKSTFINALLQQELLTTDLQEATYTITKFKYNEQAFLEIQFRDGSIQKDTIDNLDFWSSRRNLKRNRKLNDVEIVTINYPNDLFKKIEIVDTPGLGSIHGIDSKNTTNFLGNILSNISKKDKEKSTRLTKQAVAKADAVICAFSNNMRKSNMNVLESFLSYFGEIGNPSNSIGIFTKCDMFWDDQDVDPFEVGQRICTNIMERQDVRKVLYTLSPIIALPAQGLQSLDDNTYLLFKELAKLDADDLYDELMIAQEFIDNDIEGCNLDRAQREFLLKTFGSYGIYIISGLVKNGDNIQEIKKKIYSESGIETLVNDIILKHFGARSDIIKANNILSRLSVLSQNIRFQNNNSELRTFCDFIYDKVDEITTQQHCFKELAMLQYYYNKNLHLSEEDEEDLLHLTGEYGYTCESRLNVEEAKYSITELKEIAYQKIQKWGQKANASLASRRDKELAAVLKRSCEIIYYHLENLSDY